MKNVLLFLVLMSISACSGVQETENPDRPMIDDSVWETTDKEVKVKGCEDWKERNPEADC